MNNGWICLPRQLIEWEWYEDTVVKCLFLHCMLRANYKDRKYKGIELKRGEFITSYANLAEETGLSVRQVRTALGKLQKSGEIKLKATSRYTIVNCCNYSLYQDYESLERQASDKQATSRRHTKDKQATTDNKYNNKNKYNNYKNKQKNSNKKINSSPSYDLEEIKKRSVLNDDFDV